jgi:hypothetical protein
MPTLEATPRPDIIDDPDCQVIDIRTANIEQFRVFNIYNKRQKTTPPGLYTMERLIDNIELSIIDRSLLVGDFNAHHHLWNSNCPSPTRAETIVNLIENQDLQLINEPDIPTYNYRNGTGSSVLDLTITTSQLARLTINWLVNSELYTGSDHEVIQFTVISEDIETVPLPTITNRYNWNKAD